jgi:hypothetical protein
MMTLLKVSIYLGMNRVDRTQCVGIYAGPFHLNCLPVCVERAYSPRSKVQIQKASALTLNDNPEMLGTCYYIDTPLNAIFSTVQVAIPEITQPGAFLY